MEPTALVPTGSTEYNDVYSEFPTNGAPTLFPGSVVQQFVVLLEKVVILAPTFEERPILVNRFNYLLTRVIAPVELTQCYKATMLQLSQFFRGYLIRLGGLP